MSEEIKIVAKIKKLKKFGDDFNILYVDSKEIDIKYKTNYGTYVLQGIGTFSEKETLTFTGTWVYNKKYSSWNFNFNYYERKKPEKKEEIASYLQSQLFKGIGPVIADRIVAKFKEDTISIIENTPERLREITGIGAKKYGEMMESYKGNENFRELVKMLSVPPINLAPSIITRISKSLGKKAVEKIEEDPYVLCNKVPRIGFKMADFIAREKFGIEFNSMYRIKASILFVLNEAATLNGHTYLPINMLFDRFRRLIPELNINDFNKAIRLLNDVEIKVKVNRENTSLSSIALKKYYNMELRIAEGITSLNTKSKNIKDVDKYIKEIEKEIGIKYASQQLLAIKQAAKSNFYAIVGGPGTGKSTIINGLIKMFRKNKPETRILLMAPTGRASKRMEEATGEEAGTIHRKLQSKQGEGFTRNEENPLDADVVIVDEASMIDVPLMSYLIKAIAKNTKVIIIGDTDQLPSVGSGAVLADIIKSNVVPVIKLNQVFRQGKDSLIKVNAQKVREGLVDLEYSENEFNLVESNDLQLLQGLIIRNYIDELFDEKEKSGSIEKALYNVQILTPTKKWLVGTIALNNAIQDYLNPNIENEIVTSYKNEDDEEISIKFRKADKVMQITNNSEKEVYNGDLGIITGIDKDKNDYTIYVEFEDGRIVEYDKEELKSELILSYAVTIHKSQGSEYNSIILITSSSMRFMNQRNLFYTGMTRAKKKAIVCGDKEAVKQSILTVKANLRYTMLKDFLMAY